MFVRATDGKHSRLRMVFDACENPFTSSKPANQVDHLGSYRLGQRSGISHPVEEQQLTDTKVVASRLWSAIALIMAVTEGSKRSATSSLSRIQLVSHPQHATLATHPGTFN